MAVGADPREGRKFAACAGRAAKNLRNGFGFAWERLFWKEEDPESEAAVRAVEAALPDRWETCAVIALDVAGQHAA
jgi:hypothetical protein